MSETDLNADVRIALSHGPVRLFRNNVGGLYDRYNRWVQFGLVVGSADLIGWRSYTIRPEDAGKQVAVFASLESKGHRYKTRRGQPEWQDAVRDAGGIAGAIQTIDAADALLKSWQPGFAWEGEHPWITLTSR